MIRALDPRYRSNLHALALSAAAALVLFLVSTDDGVRQAISIGFRAGAATVGVWAMTRELDPDHPSSAGLAA
ncbi:MAG: hypothetical protein OEM40_09270, partial [Acidimicrobiia bacterium]|nr:hypothetical protein [Acidimicrobiia bacterium]